MGHNPGILLLSEAPDEGVSRGMPSSEGTPSGGSLGSRDTSSWWLHRPSGDDGHHLCPGMDHAGCPGEYPAWQESQDDAPLGGADEGIIAAH